MSSLLSARDFVSISEAARILGVSDQTLRNWDGSGKLQAYRHPVNGYRLYRVADLEDWLRELRRSRESTLTLPDLETDQPGSQDADDGLPPCHWSPTVALDPKHRPQQWDAPATTVRRDWRKYPQEAHVISADGRRYRRLTPDEIAILQGFDPGVFDGLDLTDREKIASVGDAVPPPLSRAFIEALCSVWDFENVTSLEICAGMGGLAEGAAAAGLRHLALIDSSPICGAILRNDRPWAADVVHVADVRDFDLDSLTGSVGLLMGGPPCQPWSRSGHRAGGSDPRDLLGHLPTMIAALRPEVFLFENVPGLLAEAHRDYLTDVVSHLRRPVDGVSYGVLVARFNAADFGVPQRRDRIFFAGFRGVGSDCAHGFFDAVADQRTHAAEPRDGRRAWITVGDAIGRSPDPGGWRQWLRF